MTEWTLLYFLSFVMNKFLDICDMYGEIPIFGGTLLTFICAYTLITLIIEEFLGEEKDE